MPLSAKLLQYAFSFYDQPTPLAVAAASPMCRRACEGRGVYTASQAAANEDVDDSLSGFVGEEEKEERRRLLRRNVVSADCLLEPVLRPEVYRRLAQGYAGLRIGHAVSFLVPLEWGGGGSGASNDAADGPERLARWQRDTQAAAHNACSHQEDDKHPALKQTATATTATITGINAQRNDKTWPTNVEGLVRVLLLFGQQRLQRKLPAAVQSSDESDSNDSCESDDMDRSEEVPGEDEEVVTNRVPSATPHAVALPSLSAARRAPSVTAPPMGAENEEEEDGTDTFGSSKKRERPVPSPSVPPDGENGPIPGNEPALLSPSFPLAQERQQSGSTSAASSPSITQSPSVNNSEDMDALFDDWELEAAAAEAAELEELRRNGGKYPRVETAAKATPTTTTKESAASTSATAATATTATTATAAAVAGSPAAPWRPRFLAATKPAARDSTTAHGLTTGLPLPPRRIGPSLESKPALPRDAPPPMAWWLNRPIGVSTASPPSQPQRTGAVPSASLCVQTVSLSVHVQYAYPRWLDWLAAQVSAHVLVGLSLSSWAAEEQRLRPFRAEAVGGAAPDSWLSPSSPPARLPKRYRLPLRAVYHEAATASFVYDVLRVVARDGCLEHLALPYYGAKGFTPDSIQEKRGDEEEYRSSKAKARRDALGRLLCRLRFLDLSQAGVTDAGVEELFEVLAAASSRAHRANVPCERFATARAPHHHTELRVLRLDGCGSISRLAFVAWTPLLRRLEVPRTAVSDDALQALCCGGAQSLDTLSPAQCGANTEEEETQDADHMSVPSEETSLGVLPQLRELSLCRCKVDLSLGILPLCFPRLERLNLKNSTVSETGLLALARSAQKLRRRPPYEPASGGTENRFPLSWVSVEGCARLHSLLPLWTLSCLRTVFAVNCPNLTDVSFTEGEEAGGEVLQNTVRAMCHGSGGGAEAVRLALGQRLVEFHLQGSRGVRGVSLGVLLGRVGRWTLTSLTLDDTDIGDDALYLLCGKAPRNGSEEKKLRQFRAVTGPPSTGGTADAVLLPPPCEALAFLSVQRCPRLRSLGMLGLLPSLRTLLAADSGLVDSGLPGLANSATLEHLDVSHTNLSDITPLAYLPRLKVLELRHLPRLTDDGLLRFVFAPPLELGMATRVANVAATLSLPQQRPALHGRGPPSRMPAPPRDHLQGILQAPTIASTSSSPPPSLPSIAAASLEVLDLSRCPELRLIGCVAHLPSLKMLRVTTAAIFDASLYGFFASRRALVLWRQGTGRERDGPHDELEGHRGRRFGDDRDEEEESNARVPPGVLTGPRTSTSPSPSAHETHTIPDLEELRRRLYTAPSQFLQFHMCHLSDVCLDSCASVRSVEPLGLLPQLRELRLDATVVDSVALQGFVMLHLSTTALAASPAAELGLRSLSIARCRYITDIGSLSGLPRLTTLDASDSSVESDSLLDMVTGRGRFYDAFLATLTGFSHRGGAQVGIEPLTTALQVWRRTASRLHTIRFSGCPFIFGVTPLLDLPALKELWLLVLPHTMDEDVISALEDKGVLVYW